MKLKWFWRLSLAVVALGVTAGPALADCVNVSRSRIANVVIAAHSPTLTNCAYAPCKPHLTLNETLLIEFEAPAGSFYAPDGLGLCPDGATWLVAQVDAAAALPGSAIDLTWVVGGEALQGGGLFNASNLRARQNLSNGKGVDLFLQYAEITTVIEANVATAAGMC